MPKRPLILVTNDDGITAPGLRKLIQVMNELGEVVVVEVVVLDVILDFLPVIRSDDVL